MRISEDGGQISEDRKQKTENRKQIRPPSSVLRPLLSVLCLLSSVFCPLTANAEQKTWNALGDKSNWSDDANWYTAGTPTASDDTLVDILNASVGLSQTFHAKSITLGGKKASTMTVNNFATGDVVPASSSDEAFYNRKGGLLILKGSAGKMTLKGAYKDSREKVAEEPSFMFYAQ